MAELHCNKGVGKDHAKWSPVGESPLGLLPKPRPSLTLIPANAATASYRLLPSIEILSSIPKELQPKFQACFPSGVISINKEGEAVVADARRDTVSREVLRHAEFEGKVRLGRVRDHFICESPSASRYLPYILTIVYVSSQSRSSRPVSTNRRSWFRRRSRRLSRRSGAFVLRWRLRPV